MNPGMRQKLLYGLLGAIVVVMGGDWLYRNFYETPLQERNARTEDLQKSLDRRQLELVKARKVKKQLEAWNARSLPSDTEMARSLYLAWLLERVKAAGIEAPNVDSSAAVSRRGMYQSLAFSVRGQGTLDQLTRFLYDFYRADHLHQIQSVGITPLRDRGRLDVSLAIEALVLPDSDRSDRLSENVAPRYAAKSLADYRVIVDRNLFGVGGGALDPVSQTWLSGITSRNDRPEAWFDLRATNTTVRLSKGQPLEVGDFRGTIVEIAENDVLIESAGERWLISIGENLDQAFAVPPEF